jgi:hypothetical protein
MMKWGWYTDTPTKCVFLHLLFLACYEPCYYKGVHLEPGQAVSSIRQIATDTGLTVKQVRTAINHLKETQEVAQSPYGKFSVFTVNNYNDYQCAGTDEGKQRAQEGHSEGTLPNIKKNKEVKNTPYNPPQGDEGVSVSKRFVPPTPEEVNVYCRERNNGIDGSEFCDFYTSKGWKVGKNPMKDWKAAVRTWERSRKQNAPQPKTESGWY